MSYPETLLSSVHDLNSQDLPQNVVHPFATPAEASCSVLQDIIHAADQLSTSLGVYMDMPITNPKLISLLRQQSTISHTLYVSDQYTKQTIEGLKKQTGKNYGEDVPLDRVELVDWCISRFESWGKVAGMETFKDERDDGGITLVLGGKVLVLDVDFTINRTDPSSPTVAISSVKTSYAIPDGDSPNTDGAAVLNTFLTTSLQRFCVAVQEPENQQNPLESAKLGQTIQDHFKYLVMLDKLAHRKGDGGIRWFVDVDQLCSTLVAFSKSESEIVASSSSLPSAPLDIFLLRSHSLPLPYLTVPSITFLTHISPSAYLSLLRSQDTSSMQEEYDISMEHLRDLVSKGLKGATVATLCLSSSAEFPLFPASISMPTLTTRPTFSLVPSGTDLEHTLPQVSDFSTDVLDESMMSGQYTWILDFTEGGKRSGVVLSQSRMRDVELVVNPLSSMDELNNISMLSFGTGSWVDLLLSPSTPASPERYTTLYGSPMSIHPPLQLHLTAPDEPGFILERVPVHSMKEVWGVLEVVREQCWLNSVLMTCQWVTEGLAIAETLPEEIPPTIDELNALLNRTTIPRKIPVNLFLPSHKPSTDALFDTGLEIQSRRPKIIMTSPERSPASGLVEIIVTYDETKPRGVGVQVNGAMGADLDPEVLEEICRRGGTLGLSGRIWAKAHSS